jgi:hypothetical protein
MNLHFVSMERGFVRILNESLTNPDSKISDTLKILNKSIKLFFSNVLNKYVYYSYLVFHSKNIY